MLVLLLLRSFYRTWPHLGIKLLMVLAIVVWPHFALKILTILYSTTIHRSRLNITISKFTCNNTIRPYGDTLGRGRCIMTLGIVYQPCP